MPEPIYKLQPHRTLHLRGFDRRGAAAALWGASDAGFTVSGVFRDPADFCVLILFDADDVFSHPRWRYLPDFDFTGIVLQFDVTYTNLQPLDSPKFPSIDWDKLDIIKADGSTAHVKLWDHAAKQSGGFAAASLTYTLHGVPAAFDRVTLWYQNLAFDYIVPGATSVDYQFFAAGAGAVHSITIGANTYSYTETAGDGSPAVAADLAAAINGVDPNAAATASANHVILTPARDDGSSVACSATDGNGPATLYQVQASTVLRAIRDQINGANWLAQGSPLSLRAAVSGSSLVITAARYGTVNTSGTTVIWASGEKFTGIDPAGTIQISGAVYNISSVDSPTQITLATSAGAQSGAVYLADRGGEDGNMIALYELHKNENLYFTPRGAAQMTGGDSTATWRVTLDFSALGITSIRQMWMTFAPQLTNAGAYSPQEWTAVFSNWTVSDADSKRELKVAGPGSVRVGSRDSWVNYTGSGWSSESGFYWLGFAKRTAQPGNSVAVEYHCQHTHDLYVGTSLYKDRGIFAVALDGDGATDLDCYLDAEPAVVTRRLVRSGVPAGKHTLTLTLKDAKNADSSGFNAYFDYLEAAVASGVPDAPQVYGDRSVATDFDTDHTYKLSPQRLVWMIDKSGLHGDIDHYAGVFWWNQRKRAGGTFPSLTVTFGGNWADGDTAFLQIGGNAFNDGAGTVMGKSVFPADTTETIATHFASFINETFVGVWASAAAGVLTITCRSPEYSFTFFTDKSSAAGTISVSGSLSGGVEGTWQIDDTITPVINRAAADWHKDYFAEIAAKGWTATAAFSMELVDPPDNPPAAAWAQRFRDNAAVQTDTGFASLKSTQCTFSDSVAAYQKQAFEEMAGFMKLAGLTPWLQFGEFLWWFFTNYDADANPGGGMAYYDADTAGQALAALGRPLASFLTPGDAPSLNNYADANFLRSRIKAHIDAIRSYVLSAHPDAKFELLWPLDVNYPPARQLNRYVNLPAECQQPAGSGLDRIKMEGLSFGATERNVDHAREAMRFPYAPPLAWPKSEVRYLLPWFNGGCPWAREYLAACRELLPNISFWAWDHLNLLGWPLPLPAETHRSALVNT